MATLQLQTEENCKEDGGSGKRYRINEMKIEE